MKSGKAEQQLDKFKAAAREHETDDSEEGFAEKIARLAKAPLVPDAPKTSGVPKVGRKPLKGA